MIRRLINGIIISIVSVLLVLVLVAPVQAYGFGEKKEEIKPATTQETGIEVKTDSKKEVKAGSKDQTVKPTETKEETKKENNVESSVEPKAEQPQELKPELKTEPGPDSSSKPAPVELPMNDSVSFFRSLMALLFVLGLIFLTTWFYKKFMGIKTSGYKGNRIPIRMMGTLPLGDRKFLSIVEVQGKHYFLGISQESVQLLDKLELNPEEIIPEERGGDFESVFAKARMLLQKGFKK